jgi:hypothetical protein
VVELKDSGCSADESSVMGHRRHGYLAAAGVGTSMIAGFALALLAVSAVIGFRGWPTSKVTPPSSVSVLPAAGVRAAGAPAAPALTRAAGRVILPAARAPARVAPAHTRAPRRSAAAPSPPPGAPVKPSRPAVDPTPKAPASAAPTAVTETPAAAPGTGDGLRRTTQDAGAKVQATTQQAAQAVAPAAPPAGDAVQATGQVAADAITSTGQALGGVLDALSPKSP